MSIKYHKQPPVVYFIYEKGESYELTFGKKWCIIGEIEICRGDMK
jgi:hypothetical protein